VTGRYAQLCAKCGKAVLKSQPNKWETADGQPARVSHKECPNPRSSGEEK
jgi:hypothetical protein